MRSLLTEEEEKATKTFFIYFFIHFSYERIFIFFLFRASSIQFPSSALANNISVVSCRNRIDCVRKKGRKINVVKMRNIVMESFFSMVDSIHEILMSCLAHPSIDSFFLLHKNTYFYYIDIFLSSSLIGSIKWLNYQ